MLAALAGSDPKAAHALVTDLLSIAGITAVGGRSVGEIADRFLEQAALGAQTTLPHETRALIERFLAIAGDPDEAAASCATFARDARLALDAALDLFESRTGFLAARGVDVSRIRFSTAFGRGLDYYTGFVFELHDPAGARERPAGRRRPLRRAARAARQRDADPGGRLCGLDRTARGRRERRMSAPFVIAVPAKGRLQENAEAFFARAGLELVKPRGARDYRGAIADLPGVEVAYLSASEIAQLLAQGAVHFGVTGEDLVREMIPDADGKVVLIDALGFGHANVVVAVPQAWIDVHSMADLDDVATAFRLKHDRKMRVATKYVNLTRDFFSAHGVTDYRIVESAGATEGAPAAGTAELIVDITTTGATLAANGLKVIEDGVILRSQANLVAARAARTGATDERATARIVLDRIAAQARAAHSAKCARALPAATTRCWRQARERFGVESPFGGPTSSGMLTLHCPPAARACAGELPAREGRRERHGRRTSTTCSRAPIRSTPSSRRGWVSERSRAGGLCGKVAPSHDGFRRATSPSPLSTAC